MTSASTVYEAMEVLEFSWMKAAFHDPGAAKSVSAALRAASYGSPRSPAGTARSGGPRNALRDDAELGLRDAHHDGRRLRRGRCGVRAVRPPTDRHDRRRPVDGHGRRVRLLL